MSGIQGMLRFINPRHYDMVTRVLQIQNVGFASLKLENSFQHAVGVLFHLEGFGHNVGGRVQAVRGICELAGRPEVSETILQTAHSLRESLGLIHLPIEAIGVELSSRDIRQIKTYLTIDRGEEQVVDRRLASVEVSDERKLQAMAALQKIDGLSRVDFSDIQRTGATMALSSEIECLGFDYEGHDVETKLYHFAKASDQCRNPFSFSACVTASNAALTLTEATEQQEPCFRLIQAMYNLGHPCTQISIERKPMGRGEARLYFDTWRHTYEGSSIVHTKDEAEAKLGAAYDAVGVVLDLNACQEMLDRAYEGALTLDCVTVDFSSENKTVKTYLRSAGDRGYGVAMDGRHA